MSDGGFLMEVEKGGRMVTATLLLPSEVTGGKPERIVLATISRTLWEMHPEMEEIFNQHLRKIMEVIMASMGGVVDAMMRVPDGADLQAFVAEAVATTPSKA